jgi:hypothetical protein
MCEHFHKKVILFQIHKNLLCVCFKVLFVCHKHETLFSPTIQYKHHDLHHFQPAYHPIIMPSGDIATTIKRLKNTIVDYDNQLIKVSNILQTFDQKKHDIFFLDFLDFLLPSHQNSKPRIVRPTSNEFQDMYDQVGSSIKRFIDKI